MGDTYDIDDEFSFTKKAKSSVTAVLVSSDPVDAYWHHRRQHHESTWKGTPCCAPHYRYHSFITSFLHGHMLMVYGVWCIARSMTITTDDFHRDNHGFYRMGYSPNGRCVFNNPCTRAPRPPSFSLVRVRVAYHLYIAVQKRRVSVFGPNGV